MQLFQGPQNHFDRLKSTKREAIKKELNLYFNSKPTELYKQDIYKLVEKDGMRSLKAIERMLMNKYMHSHWLIYFYPRSLNQTLLLHQPDSLLTVTDKILKASQYRLCFLA